MHRVDTSTRAAILAVEALIVFCAACDPTAGETYDDFRAMAPLTCKDYCEERTSCEWRGVSLSPEDQDAFSAAVRLCETACTGSSVEGGYVYHLENFGDGVEYHNYDELIEGGELISGFECLYNAGAYRCVDAGGFYVHQLQPPVLSICEYANQCIAAFGIDYSLSWTPDPSGLGGVCTRGGTEYVNALFFDDF